MIESSRIRSWLPPLALLLAASCSGGDGAGDAARPRSILLVSIDTLRADHIACYGYPRDTSPVIDALAAESIFFERCLSPLAATLPAHTSLFTGTYPLEHGVLGNIKGGGRRFVANPVLRLFAEFARARGYRTAGFVSSVAVSQSTGLAGGFDLYDEPTDAQRTAGETNERLLPWLDGLSKDEPFFLFVHYYDPHWPYKPPPPFDTRYAGDSEFLERYIAEREISETAVRPNQNDLSTRDTIDGYDGEVRYADGELGRLIDKLKARGLWDETAVILLGDHGEGLGEHGQIGHGWIWHEQLHVPLMMHIPGQPPRRVIAPMSLVDVLPTALGLLGAEPWHDFLRQTTGTDVLARDHVPAPVFAQRSAREREDLEGQVFALLTDRFTFVLDSARGDQLYDRQDDPFELRNAVERETERAEAMRRALAERIAIHEERGRVLGEIPADRPMDAETLEKLRGLGYVD